MEDAFPALGLVEVEDPETGERALVDSSSPMVRRAFQAAVTRGKAGRTQVFRKLELDSVELRAGEDHGGRPWSASSAPAPGGSRRERPA